MIRKEQLRHVILISFVYLVLETDGSRKSSAPKIGYVSGKNPYDPGECNDVTKGDLRMVKDRNHLNKFLLCIKQAKHFYWKMMSNSGHSYGNYFDPAKSCSSILDKIPAAKSGVYWIKTNNGPRKAWCDMVTDGGGFLLIGVQDSSRTMDVPSDTTLVHPLDLRHWSSSFGDDRILDFRIQIATSKKWSDTKAHWYYRFNALRNLSNLLLFNDGGCDNHHPGIGDVKFVKDLKSNAVVTKNFECSRFDVYFHKNLGWGKMNSCFKTPCKTGFDYLNFATSGAFSYSVESRRSGITNNSTKFIGCEKDKCCVCYGPSNDKDYCAPGCRAINGGTVLTDKRTNIHVWFWVRPSLPKRVWKKCMEFYKLKGGKPFKWHVDEHTKVPVKGPCSYPGDVKFNDGVAVVDNKQILKKLPNIEGLLSYQADSQELYLRRKNEWGRMAEENEVLELRKELKESKTEISQLSKRLLKIEANNKVYSSCKSALKKIGNAQHGVYKIKDPSVAHGYSMVYCHMTSMPGCSGGGWTLVMKVNGNKETFYYHSSYWSNKVSYNPGGGQSGLNDQETKLPTYWTMPFRELCLGMKVNSRLNFITIPYRASSLYSVIASGSYRATSIGRNKWLSLVQGSRLQPNCNLEGFNLNPPGRYRNLQVARIGIIGNEQNNCLSSDSYFGFGGLAKHKRIHCRMPKIANTCGNAAYCMPSRSTTEIPAMGYIFVR